MAEAGPSSPRTLVLRAPESLPSELLQEMQSEIASMKRQSKEQKDFIAVHPVYIDTSRLPVLIACTGSSTFTHV